MECRGDQACWATAISRGSFRIDDDDDDGLLLELAGSAVLFHSFRQESCRQSVATRTIMPDIEFIEA
jgi:hypothetical protein